MDKKRILIVEDEGPYREMVAAKFSDNGFEISEASNGQEGLAKALAEKPDLILTDIIMPKMDGLEMIKKIKEDTWGRNVPFIIITNVKDALKTAEAMELGVFDFFVKSEYDFHKILGRVKHVLGLFTQ